ncbi:MAG: transporter substrate-binding domain-containing protein [Bacteroidota bacterium]
MKARPVLFVFLLVAMLVAACRNDNTPTPAAPVVPPTATTDQVWNKVASSGRIIFGSSIDYAPFESYDPYYQPTGFDIALAREIGTRLGLQVQFQDMAFESLLSAVQVGQVDAGIAAISVTPDRQQTTDFSNIYFNDKTSALSRQGSGIKITSPNQIASYRVGVQRGTTYEQWIKTTLIDPGLMPPTNLFTYQQPDHVVNDLKNGYVDVVVMGALPAADYVKSGGVEISGESLNVQLYAIAFAKGNPSLQSRLNEALNTIQTDGTLARLASQYLGINSGTQPLPTPPPSSSTPAPPPIPCDSMTFVSDLTVPDGTQMNPGQSFTKTWRIKNTGSCTWNSSYRFVFVQGNSMGGQPQSIQGTVAPNQTYDMSVPMTAPTNPGTYAGWWQMANAQNTPFGTRVWVEIVVPAPPPQQPQPTPAAPSIEYFTGPQSAVQVGEVIPLKWAFSTQDVVSAKLNRINPDGTVTALYGGADVSTPGTYDDLAVAPGTYTYTLAVSTEFGGTQTATVVVGIVQ